MLVFIGLGNPGPRYVLTRHNVGLLFVDELLKKFQIGSSYRAETYEAFKLKSQSPAIAVKPLTYMNNSGIAVRDLIRDFGLSQNDRLIVIYDDVWIPLGRLRIRERGSDGGHNGVKSIISSLGTQEFSRIRIGIGPKPDDIDMISYVLGEFTDSELKVLWKVLDLAISAAQEMFAADFKKVMSRYNSIGVE